MARKYMETVLTPAVKEAQKTYYGITPVIQPGPEKDPLRPEEIEFIAARDSFYMATITESGWPYLQHRGGPTGFLRVLSPHQLAFLDVPGNRQLLSTGNLTHNNRVSLFLMDYAQRQRLKILGHAQILDARVDSELAARLQISGHLLPAERIFIVEILSYDWNCSKYITPRFTAEDVEEILHPLRNRILELEKQLAELKHV